MPHPQRIGHIEAVSTISTFIKGTDDSLVYQLYSECNCGLTHSGQVILFIGVLHFDLGTANFIGIYNSGDKPTGMQSLVYDKGL